MDACQICSPRQAKLICGLSACSLLTGLVGIVGNHPYLGTGTFLGSLFAMNYWRNPKYSWRRTMDICWVQLMIWSHLWHVWGTPVAPTYILIQSLGAVSFGLGWILHKKNYGWSATICHAAVHVAANSSLLLFYVS